MYINPFSGKFLEIFTKNSFSNFRASNGARGLLFELNCMKIHSSCSEFYPLSKRTRPKILNFNNFGVIGLWMVVGVFDAKLQQNRRKGQVSHVYTSHMNFSVKFWSLLPLESECNSSYRDSGQFSKENNNKNYDTI